MNKSIFSIITVLLVVFTGYVLLRSMAEQVSEVIDFCSDKEGIVIYHGEELNCSYINENGVSLAADPKEGLC